MLSLSLSVPRVLVTGTPPARLSLAHSFISVQTLLNLAEFMEHKEKVWCLKVLRLRLVRCRRAVSLVALSLQRLVHASLLLLAVDPFPLPLRLPLLALHPALSLTALARCRQQALPIDLRTLGDLALRCHTYAKALHYKVRAVMGSIFVASPVIVEHCWRHGFDWVNVPLDCAASLPVRKP